MGIKYNGSDVQAIYYNGFTIAKMMNNGSAVWTPPANSILLASDFTSWPKTAFTSWTTPDGYLVDGYTFVGISNKSAGTLRNVTGSVLSGMTIKIPELAGKDYKFNIRVFGAYRYDYLCTGIIIQDTDNGGGVGYRVGGTSSTYSLYPVIQNGTARKVMTSSISPTWTSISAAFMAQVDIRTWFDYEQRRTGNTLYTKVKRSTGTVYENTYDNVTFNNTGDLITILTSTHTSGTTYYGAVENYTLEIFG